MAAAKITTQFRIKSIAIWLSLLMVSWLLSTCTAVPVQAATGINSQLNFQGRLLNGQGAIVADGNYNIQFKIYQDGTGCVSSGSAPCGGTLLWTEIWQNSNSQGVAVANGYFSVQLGSLCSLAGGSCQGNTNTGVNWNSDTLWLSINIGGTSTGASPTYDGEMTPFKRLTASPYSFNSTQLGGLNSSSYVQLAQGLQTDSSTSNAAIAVNKTGGTANVITLQRSGTTVFQIDTNGATTFQPQTDSATAFRILQNSSSNPLFVADTLNNKVYIGNPTADATGVLLVLDTKNTAGDPTGVVGGSYYNSSTGKFRCYENGDWHDCAGGELGYAQTTSNLGSNVNTATDITGLSTTVTVPANHRIRITASTTPSAGVTNGSAIIDIAEGSTMLRQFPVFTSSASNFGMTGEASVILTPTSGSHTYKIQIQPNCLCTVTNNASATNPSFILVEDIGQ